MLFFSNVKLIDNKSSINKDHKEDINLNSNHSKKKLKMRRKKLIIKIIQ